jgi:hypothetical protein
MRELETHKETEQKKSEKDTVEILKKETRKGNTPIYVWVTSREKQLIQANAKACAMSTSAYLRQVGMGMPIKSVLDHQCIADLAKVNADQGRLGGLLKLWLTNDAKLKLYDRARLNMNILKLLEEIRRLQAVLFEKATSI